MAEDLYRAPQAELIEPPLAQQLRFASRGTRLGATILDQLMVLAAMLPILIGLIPAIADGPNAQPDELLRTLAPWLVLSGLLWLALLAVNLVLMARDGQTIAKRWLGIRVLRTDGSPLSLGRYIGLRVIPVNVLQQVPLFGFVVALADPLLIFRDSYKCLHDEIADTIVVVA